MNHDIDIKELGYRIKKGDEKAFQILYVEYFYNLQYYAMRYLYDWEEAENLVQDAFLSLWCNLDKYDEERNVVYYLLTFVRNSCLKYIRNLKIRDNNQDKVIEALLFSNMTDEEPDENLLKRLNEVLSRLPDKQKEVLLKHTRDRSRTRCCGIHYKNSLQTGNDFYEREFTYYLGRILNVIERTSIQSSKLVSKRKIAKDKVILGKNRIFIAR